MAHPSNSYSVVLADLTAAVTATANGDFTSSGGTAVAGVGGVVAGICPDTIVVDTTAGALTVTLPKIGTQNAPVGTTVAVRKKDANANLITIAAHPSSGATDAADAIDDAATNVAAFIAVANRQSAQFRATSIAAPVAPALNGVGQWRTVASSTVAA